MMQRWVQAFTVRGRDEGGSILPLTALLLVVLMAVGAVAVDTGRLAASSRDLQGVTDRAALDAILAMRDDTKSPEGAGRAGVLASLERNPGLAGSGLAAPWAVADVEPGRFANDGTFIPDPSSRDGVRVILDSSVDSIFLPGTSDLRREAIARQDAIASIAAGTATARLDDGALNDVLGGLLGANVSLDLISYQGIAATNIRLGAIAAELGVGTVDELLDTHVSINRLLEVMIAAIELDGGTAAVGLEQLLLTLGPLPQIRLGDLLDVAGGEPALGANVNALDLLMGAVQVANGGSAVAIDLDVPGVLGVDLTVVEPPVLAVGRAALGADSAWMTRARTAQTALDLELELLGDLGLEVGLLGLDLLEVELLDDLQLRVDTGVGEVELTGASCGDPGQLAVNAKTAGASVTLAAMNIADIKVHLSVPLLGSIPIADIAVSLPEIEVSVASAEKSFPLPGEFPTPVHSVGTSELGLADGLLAEIGKTGVLDVDVKLLGLVPVPGGLVGAIAGAVIGLLADVLAPLDTIIGDLLGGLGIQAGVMDVWGVDLDCSGRYLAG